MDAFDLKFSRVTGIDHIRPLAKFHVGHVTSWYFTDNININGFRIKLKEAEDNVPRAVLEKGKYMVAFW